MKKFLRAALICTMVAGVSYSVSPREANAQYYIKKESKGSNFFSRLFGWGKQDQKQKEQTQTQDKKKTPKQKKPYWQGEETTGYQPLLKDEIKPEDINEEISVIKTLQEDSFGKCTQEDREYLAEFNDKEDQSFENMSDPAYRRKMAKALKLPDSEEMEKQGQKEFSPEELGLKEGDDDEQLKKEWEEYTKAMAENDEFSAYLLNAENLQKQMQAIFRCKTVKDITADQQKKKQEREKKYRRARR